MFMNKPPRSFLHLPIVTQLVICQFNKSHGRQTQKSVLFFNSCRCGLLAQNACWTRRVGWKQQLEQTVGVTVTFCTKMFHRKLVGFMHCSNNLSVGLHYSIHRLCSKNRCSTHNTYLEQCFDSRRFCNTSTCNTSCHVVACLQLAPANNSA